MADDPLFKFLQSVTEKIKVEKEHKALMDKIDDNIVVEPAEDPLLSAINVLKQKIVEVKQPAILEVIADNAVITTEVASETIEEKDNFGDFLSKLKDIISSDKPKNTTPIVSVETTAPVVQELENAEPEIEDSKPEVQDIKNDYVDVLDKLSNEVAVEKEPQKISEIKKLIEQYAEKYFKKAAVMSEYAGGGGTNAVQYANGGTMNGDLNVTGNYLSAGVNLLNIFSGGNSNITNPLILPNNTNPNGYSLNTLDSGGAKGGSITMTGSTDGDNVANAGNINTSAGAPDGGGGGSIDLTGARSSGGSLIMKGGEAFGAYGGSINTSGVASPGDPWHGGSIDTSGGGPGPGGSINTSNGGGSINTQGGVYGTGGSINTSDGGGYISTNGFWNDGDEYGKSGGSINTSGGEGGTGGSINTSGGVDDNGGSIDTSNGGGSINTREGYIQLGSGASGNIQTTLQGTAAGGNKTIYLPNDTGTLLLSSPYIVYNNQDTTFGYDVTINGNLTALGTSTFKNTIFTTTSALSVVNTGPGPALYVFQAAGPYDVASFYDGDGVEVLHVGNANVNEGGKVGINESYPGAELTVNGAISSNGTITAENGNSNDWSSNYTTTNTNSAFWTNAYTNLVTNSATYLGTTRQFDIVAVEPNSYNYIGYAVPGSTTSQSVWTIKRLYFSTAGTLLSSGIITNAIWNNRYSYTY